MKTNWLITFVFLLPLFGKAQLYIGEGAFIKVKGGTTITQSKALNKKDSLWTPKAQLIIEGEATIKGVEKIARVASFKKESPENEVGSKQALNNKLKQDPISAHRPVAKRSLPAFKSTKSSSQLASGQMLLKMAVTGSLYFLEYGLISPEQPSFFSYQERLHLTKQQIAFLRPTFKGAYRVRPPPSLSMSL